MNFELFYGKAKYISVDWVVENIQKIFDIIENSWVKKFYALFTSTIISLIGIIYVDC